MTASRQLAVLTAVLIAFGIACEVYFSPLRPGGSWLVLKGLPIIILLPGLWQNRLRSVQWLSLIVLLYVAEGCVRGMSDAPALRLYGWIGAALSTFVFLFALFLAKHLKAKKTSSTPA
jgi:uncharacterized membrane protein